MLCLVFLRRPGTVVLQQPLRDFVPVFDGWHSDLGDHKRIIGVGNRVIVHFRHRDRHSCLVRLEVVLDDIVDARLAVVLNRVLERRLPVEIQKRRRVTELAGLGVQQLDRAHRARYVERKNVDVLESVLVRARRIRSIAIVVEDVERTDGTFGDREFVVFGVRRIVERRDADRDDVFIRWIGDCSAGCTPVVGRDFQLGSANETGRGMVNQALQCRVNVAKRRSAVEPQMRIVIQHIGDGQSARQVRSQTKRAVGDLQVDLIGGGIGDVVHVGDFQQVAIQRRERQVDIVVRRLGVGGEIVIIVDRVDRRVVHCRDRHANDALVGQRIQNAIGRAVVFDRIRNCGITVEIRVGGEQQVCAANLDRAVRASCIVQDR